MKQLRSVTFLLFLAAASPLLGANLVLNGAFNGTLNGWYGTAGPTTTYDGSSDATGAPGSGSARLVASHSGFATGPYQCIAVVPGRQYTLSGKIFIPSGQSSSGLGFVGVTWAGGDCLSSSSPIYGTVHAFVTTTGSFVTVSQVITPPPGTTNAYLNLTALNNTTAPLC